MTAYSAEIGFFSTKKPLFMRIHSNTEKRLLSLYSDQVVKSIGTRHMGGRAVARAETAPPPAQCRKCGQNWIFVIFLFWHAARAQPRARLCSARQWILRSMEMFFDYLIAI